MGMGNGYDFLNRKISVVIVLLIMVMDGIILQKPLPLGSCQDQKGPLLFPSLSLLQLIPKRCELFLLGDISPSLLFFLSQKR